MTLPTKICYTDYTDYGYEKKVPSYVYFIEILAYHSHPKFAPGQGVFSKWVPNDLNNASIPF